MAQYIDKSAVIAEIESLISNGQVKLQESQKCNDYENYVAWAERIATYINVLSLLDTLEVKEVDLEKETTHYLLHEHRSPLNEIMHQADLNAEMQYHKDIENAYKAGFELGLQARIDKELVKEVYAHIDDIKNTADKMTSGNFMHNRASIKFSANTIAKVLELIGLKVQKG